MVECVENGYRYKAFISYRHISPDKVIADKLQKKLESFKLPKTVKEGKEKNGWRVFRDETELPTSSNLSEDIRQALRQSEYLIVVCSEKTSQSAWCMHEIEYFKELHNGNNSKIITVLVSGNPSDVFPKSLCNELVEEIDENGNLVYKNRVIEPLAANVTGSSTTESLKKLGTEYLRIAAPLSGCRYDDLYNREQRKKIRRILSAVAIVITLLLGFLIYNSLMLLEINNQKNALAIANENLQIKTVEAQENMYAAMENEAKANEQTRLFQIESSQNLALLSENLWKSGDTRTAIEMVLSALPEKETDRPVVPSAVRLLAKELGAFETDGVKMIKKLVHNKSVNSIRYVGNGKSIVTQDDTGTYLWLAQSGELIRKFEEDDDGFVSTQLIFEDDDKIRSSSIEKKAAGVISFEGNVVNGYKKSNSIEENVSGSDFYVVTYNGVEKICGETGQTLWTVEKNWHRGITLNGNSIVVTVQDLSSKTYNFERYDSKTGLLVEVCNFNYDSDQKMNCLLFAENAVFTVKQEQLTEETVYRYSVTDGKMYSPVRLEAGGEYEIGRYVKHAESADGKLAVLYKNEGLLFHSHLMCVYDMNSGRKLWEYDCGNYSAGITKIGKIYAEHTKNKEDIFFVLTGDRLALIGAENGFVYKTFLLDGNAVDVYYSVDGMIYVITDSGKEIAIVASNVDYERMNQKNYLGMYNTYSLPNKPSYAANSNFEYAVANDVSTDVYIYSDVSNSDYTNFFDGNKEFTVKEVMVDASGRYAAINCYTSLFVYNFDTKTLNHLIDTDEYFSKVAFMGDNICVSFGDKTYVYNLDTGEQLFATEYEFSGIVGESFVVAISYSEDLDKQLMLTDKNGETKTWFTRMPSIYSWREFDYGRFYYCYPSPISSRILIPVNHLEHSKNTLEVYDADTENSTVLEEFETGSEKEIHKDCVVWLDLDRVAVVYTDRTIGLYNSATGECINVEAYDDIPTILDACAVGNENEIMVVCDNGAIYRIDLSTHGITKASDFDDAQLLSALSRNVSLECYEKSNIVILSCSEYAYILDFSSLEVMFEVDSYGAFNNRTNSIVTKKYDYAGYYPLYSVEQLVEKGKDYLGE